MDKRSTAILRLLLETDHYISVDILADSLNVSRRTIYNDIGKINFWLEENYESQIEKVHARGMYIPETAKHAISSSLNLNEIPYYEYSKEERQSWIIVLLSIDLFNSYFIETFQLLFGVSRNTVIDDIKQLKVKFCINDLSINSEVTEGYIIHGDEAEIRKMLMEAVQNLNINIQGASGFDIDRMDQPILPDHIKHSDDHQRVKNIIASYEKTVGIEITDDILPTLSFWMFCFIQRIRNKKYIRIKRSEKEAIESAEEFKFAVEILMKELNEIPLDETVYLTKFLLGAKIKFSKSSDYTSEDIVELESVISSMIENFEQHAAVFFSEKDALFNNLLLHMKPAYYRIKYHINIDNPLKDEIKTNYFEIFSITRQIVPPLEELLKQKINDDELAYIAIHFGGWLKRNSLIINKRILKIMLVCTNGIGTSRIMENQMINLLPEYEVVSLYSENEYEKLDSLTNKVDFVVSSTPLSDKDVPVIVVNPLFSQKDREKVLSHGKLDELDDYNFETNASLKVDTLLDIIKKYSDIHDSKSLRKEIADHLSPKIIANSPHKPALIDLLPENRIQVIDYIENWESAINKAAEPLIEYQSIEPSYVKAMKDIINEKGTYMVMSEEIALPHALPSHGVNKTGMSILLLKNSIQMKDKKVKLFIVLASIDNENHLRAMTHLTRIFSDQNRRNEILNAENRHALINALDF